MENLVLACDLGTSGPKVALVNAEGNILAESTEKTKLYFTEDGGVEQDPENWWEAILRGISNLRSLEGGNAKALLKRVVAISCTSQWSGTVPLDEKGEPLHRAIIWMDARGAPFIKKLVGGTINLQGYHPLKLYKWIRQTGGAPGMGGKDSLAHILYLKNALPKVYEKTYKFLEPKDYLNFRFTGLMKTSHETMALHWITDNRNIKSIIYGPELLRLAQIEARKLPEMGRSIDILGPLKSCLAKKLGLKEGTPVILGTPDIQSSAIGSGAVEDFAPHLYIGTSSWLTCHVPFKKTSLATNMATLPSAIPGRYFVACEQESAGICLDFLKELLFSQETERDYSEAELFQKLDEMATSVSPKANNLIFTPWLNGERTPVENHLVRGGFYNLSLGTKREDMVKAVMEGVAFNCRWLLKAVETFVGKSFSKIHFLGGGATSPVWCQIMADILERPIAQLEGPRQANTRGAAWLAFVALGQKEFADISKDVLIRQDFSPDETKRGFYQKRFREFLQIYHKNKNIFKRLNGESVHH